MSETKALQGIWTQYGLEREAAARAGGEKLTITHAAVGSGRGSIPTVSAAQTALLEEVWRGMVNSVQLNPDDATDVIIDVVLPNDIGGFWIREWGLFDDKGTLVAVGPHDEMHKPTIDSGQAVEFLERFHLPTASSAAITLNIATQALATQGFVQAEVKKLTVKYGTAAGTACQGNDGRLSDARTPLAHTHRVEDITGDYFALSEVGQYRWFEDTMPREGYVPLRGLKVTGISRYPKMIAYLQTTWGQARCTTQADWDARHSASFYTAADGSKIGWGGKGGVNRFVWDQTADTLLVPDLSGLSPEQIGYDSLGVGDARPDAIRQIQGRFSLMGANSSWVLAGIHDSVHSGVFYPDWDGRGYTLSGAGGSVYESYHPTAATFHSSRVVPTGPRVTGQTYLSDLRVYLGLPVS